MNDSVVVLWNLWVAPKSRLDHDGNQQRCAVCGCSMLDRLTVLSIFVCFNLPFCTTVELQSGYKLFYRIIPLLWWYVCSYCQTFHKFFCYFVTVYRTRYGVDVTSYCHYETTQRRSTLINVHGYHSSVFADEAVVRELIASVFNKYPAPWRHPLLVRLHAGKSQPSLATVSCL